MHSIRSKARHAAWKQDGTNFNPFSRTQSRNTQVGTDPEQGFQTEQENHSGTCVTDTQEMTRHQNNEGNGDINGVRHAATFSSSPTTTTSHNDFAHHEKHTPANSAAATNGTNGSANNFTVVQRRNKFKPWKKDTIAEDNTLERTTSGKPKKKKGKPLTIGSQIKAVLFGSWINVLLLVVPIGFVMEYTHQNGIAIFVVNFIAIIPLAAMLSYSTEEIALRTGEVLGGLLNASFGNAVELIVSIQALIQGQIVIVKTSLIGSMLSNLLLVMGMSFFFGGINRVEQFFNVTVAQTAASLLALSIGSLIVPTVFREWTPTEGITDSELEDRAEALSRGTSIILLLVYACYLLFQLKSHREMYNEPSKKVEKRKSKTLKDGQAVGSLAQSGAGMAATSGGSVNQGNLNDISSSTESEEEEAEEPQLTLIGALVSLGLSTTLVAFCSEFMVSAIDQITGPGSPVSKTFVGLILLPIVGNAAEHATAVTVACKDKMDLAIGVAVGSSMQIALLVIPLIDVLGWITGSKDCHGNMMSLNFDGFQLAVLFVAVLLVNYLIQDGKSHWLEGILLMASYIIIAIAAWYYPTGEDCQK